MKNLLHSLLLPAALLLAGGAANIPARSTSPAAGTAPGPSLGVRDDASVAFRAPRSIPPTGLRPWVPPAHEAAGGHGPLGITPGLQDTLTGTVKGRSTAAHPRKAALNCRVKAFLVKTSYFRNLVMKVSMPLVATSRMWVMRLSLTGTSSGSMM